MSIDVCLDREPVLERKGAPALFGDVEQAARRDVFEAREHHVVVDRMLQEQAVAAILRHETHAHADRVSRDCGC